MMREFIEAIALRTLFVSVAVVLLLVFCGYDASPLLAMLAMDAFVIWLVALALDEDREKAKVWVRI